MADYATILRIGKILARASSPEPEEAKTALSHTYKRMVKEQVTLKDLLKLPDEDLYQDTLVHLVNVILDNDKSLSMSARRKAYAEYMRLIADRFSPPHTGRESEAGQGGGQSRSREEEAKDYENRTGYEKTSSRGFSQENEKTQKQENVKTEEPTQPQKEDWLQYIRPHFQRGGVFWLIFHYPVQMGRYFCASLLWGMGLAAIIITVLAIVHVLSDMEPVFNPSLKAMFTSLSAIGTLWRYHLFVKAL